MQYAHGRVAAMATCALILVGALMAAPAGAQAPQPYQRGFVLTGWKAGSYLSPGSDSGLRRMANDGSNQAAVFTQWFMDGPSSSRIAPDPERTPTDAAILHAMDVARSADMSVTLKPQIGLRSGNWIGYAHPADLDAFWSDYRTMLLHYADLAQQGGASMLVVGTEMATLSSDATRWRALIAEVRTHFSGELTYAANYDEFQRITFWDALDYIGIDAYFGLADDADPAPGADALTTAWTDRGYLARIRAVSERAARKVLFTEIGYRATQTTAVHPNIWNGTQVTDTWAQASAYEAFYRAVSQQSWMAGFYWWEVNADQWWVQDYNPIGKDAEQVLVEWNQRPASPPSLEPPAATPDEPAAPTPDAAAPAADATPPATDTRAAPDPTPAGSEAAARVPHTGTTPGPGPSPTPAPLPAVSPAVKLTVRGRALKGAVRRYSPACDGVASLWVRAASRGRWVLLRVPQRVRLDESGRFTQRLRGGRLRVRVLFSSRCGRAASAWTTVPA